MQAVGRRDMVTLAAAGLAGSLASGAARAEDVTPEVSWTMTSSFPRTLDLMYGGAESFARFVSDLTGGRFQITVSPPGEVVPGLQAIDAVQSGLIDSCQTSLDYAYAKDPTFALPTAVPFGLNARGQAAFAYGGTGEAVLASLLSTYKLVAFPAGNTGAQMGGFFRRPLQAVADLAGLRIRIGGLGGEVLRRLGALPQAIPRSEMAAALGQGRLDAATWVSPYDDEKLGADDAGAALQKVAPYYYYPGWWRGASAIHVVCSQPKYDALPKPFQAALRAAAQMAEAQMLARYDTRNPAALKRLVVSGAQLRAFPQDIMEAAYKATNDVFRDLADGNPTFKAMLEALLAFRSDAYLWWQVGEYTFDNFMIRERAKG